MKKYPLTPAQLVHHLPIIKFGTQKVANVSALCALQTPLDFEILKKSIQLEYQRCECLRLRFTKPDAKGMVLQYVAPSDDRDIPYKDLSDMTMDKADELMQNWAYETFDGNDIPMVVITMMKLPDSYNGIYIHIDHRLADSSGLIAMTEDLMAVYCHFAFGAPLPDAPASYLQMLEKDLAKASNDKRIAKDQKFWEDTLLQNGEPLYSDIQGPDILEKSRHHHKNSALRAADLEKKDLSVAVADFHLEEAPTREILSFCETNQVSVTNLLLMGLRSYLSKVNNGQEDITIRNFISRRSTHEEWSSGGSRTIAYPCRTIISPDTDFLGAVAEIQNVQNHVYLHNSYDPESLASQMKELYHFPDGTGYDSMALTYQPMPVRAQNEYLKNIRTRSVWYPNGAANKKVYLTVTHSTTDEGLDFSFHYQSAHLSYHDMELLYYYMMKILFQGMKTPSIPVGELLSAV